MKHWIKTATFKCLSALPEGLGDAMYHTLQRVVSSQSIGEEITSKNTAYERMQAILSGLEVPFRNQRILEIGSGWLPILPYFMKFKGGCAEVFTYDINRHFNKNRIRDFARIFFADYCPGSNPPGSDAKFGLPAGIAYFPSTDILVNPPAAQSIDLVVSVNVLEHVHPDTLLAIHRESGRYLTEDGLFVHLVSPSDHRAYSDLSLSLYDFLQYSQEEWDHIQTRFDYHNRLRFPQYLQLFKDSGFDVLYQQFSTAKDHPVQAEKFSHLRLHDDFKNFSFDELTAGSLAFVLKRSKKGNA